MDDPLDRFSMNFFTMVLKLASDCLDLTFDRSESLDLTSAREEEVCIDTKDFCFSSVEDDGSEKCEDVVEDRKSYELYLDDAIFVFFFFYVLSSESV